MQTIGPRKYLTLRLIELISIKADATNDWRTLAQCGQAYRGDPGAWALLSARYRAGEVSP